MINDAVLIGVGEIGSVFAKGCLKSDYRVTPVNRNHSITKVLSSCVDTNLIINTVGESDLNDTLLAFPKSLSDKLVLVQNELLPHQWQKFDIEPTIISIWFEKKPGKEAKQIIPSPVFGKKAKEVSEILNKVSLSTKLLTSKEELLFELVLKNVYILTTNLCGLITQGNVGNLKDNHKDLMINIFNEVVSLQEKLTNNTFDKSLLMNAMLDAFEGDLLHNCMGRSAPARLERAKKNAIEFNLSLPYIFNL